MDSDRWGEINACFNELVELGKGERSARLAALQATNPEVGRWVAALLDADARPNRVIDEPAKLLPGRGTLDPYGLNGRTLSHFRVHEVLGAGGMGVVYRAVDARLGRAVALKLLLPHHSLDRPARERFLREARAASALDHPNICTVYETGEGEDGQLFIAMALYAGDTLRERLDRPGPFPVEEAREIVVQVAQGLGHAHAAGVVHRDLKPGNLIVAADGTTKILDFGLAEVRDLTATGPNGEAAGTLAYMSPEQLRGGPVDSRSDLWSLGGILYEMLTGRRPFGGDNELSAVHAILNEEPVPPSALREGLPPRMEEIVTTLLQKDPAARFPTAESLLAALREASPTEIGARRPRSTGPVALVWGLMAVLTLAAAGVVAVLAADGPGSGPLGPKGAAEATETRSIAVLPFDHLDAAPHDKYLARGIHDEILTQLAKVGGLRVISRTSVLGYADTEKPISQIGEELGVAVVLEGTVQRVGDRVRVNAQLIDARTDEHLWAQKYDRELTDVLAIQSEVARSIVRELRVKLTPNERTGLARLPTRNRQAYTLYLRALEYDRRNTQWEAQSYGVAEQLYLRAIALDPAFALARARLAQVHGQLYQFGYDRSAARFGQWRTEAESALRLQPGLPEAHYALGHYWLWGHRDFPRALQEFAKAQAGLPNDAELEAAIAYTRRRQGHWEDALARLRRAAALDPRNPRIGLHVATTLESLRRYPEAVAAFDRVLEVAPDYRLAARGKASAYLGWHGTTDTLAAMARRFPPLQDAERVGPIMQVELATLRRRPVEALAALQSMDRESFGPYSSGRMHYTALLRAHAYRALGDTAAARTNYESARIWLERLVAERPDDPYLRPPLGMAYAGLGRKADAIREARRGLEILPISVDALEGPTQTRLAAEVLARVGETDAALDLLERLLRLPSGGREVSPALLRIDPIWDPLRGHARFARLVAEAR